MSEETNPFDFVAGMWRGAEPMVQFQRDEPGDQLEFTGQELADIVAFLLDEEEQKRFFASDIPANIRAAIAKMEHGQEEDEQGNKDRMIEIKIEPELERRATNGR